MGNYYVVGNFVRDKSGKIFRITGIKMEDNEKCKYSIVPVHLDKEYSQVVDGESLSKMELL